MTSLATVTVSSLPSNKFLLPFPASSSRRRRRRYITFHFLQFASELPSLHSISISFTLARALLSIYLSLHSRAVSKYIYAEKNDTHSRMLCSSHSPLLSTQGRIFFKIYFSAGNKKKIHGGARKSTS
jgi:hypothetical protein